MFKVCKRISRTQTVIIFLKVRTSIAQRKVTYVHKVRKSIYGTQSVIILCSRFAQVYLGPQPHITSEHGTPEGLIAPSSRLLGAVKYCASGSTCARRAATVPHFVWTSPTHPTPCHQRSKPGSSRVQDGLLHIHISPTCRPQKKVEVQSKSSASTAAHRSTCYRSSKHSCLCPASAFLHLACP